MYKYETHLHTKTGSACATVSGAEQAIEYKKAGYSGIFITDHFFRGNSCIPKAMPWDERIELFCRGYEEAKRVGDKIGLQVFFGWEETFEGQDFLVYGLNKQWLLSHPETEHWTIQEQFNAVSKAGGLVIHAHPFRNRPYIPKIRLFPKWVHGVEVYNACNYEEENKEAFYYAKKYNLPMTAGADSHHHEIIKSGIAVDDKFADEMDYVKLIKENMQKNLIYVK
jgi:hypothetical protein